jgi:hypothetical protein
MEGYAAEGMDVKLFLCAATRKIRGGFEFQVPGHSHTHAPAKIGS